MGEQHEDFNWGVGTKGGQRKGANTKSISKSYTISFTFDVYLLKDTQTHTHTHHLNLIRHLLLYCFPVRS